MGWDTLQHLAIDLGIISPDLIPSIPRFKNVLKYESTTAHNIFSDALSQIEVNPGLAIGLANSALESIIKEILKDDRIRVKITGGETLYRLGIIILKEFKLTNPGQLKETKIIGNSLLSILQAIEDLRCNRTNFHGKTNDDYLIKESIYATFVVNSVATIGPFLYSYYHTKYPKINRLINSRIGEHSS